MATRSDIKKLLSSGLTGWEAGLLVFEDSWKIERGDGGFLGDRDIEVLKASLRSQKDIEDYNTLIRLFKTADYLEKQCKIGLASASYLLERVTGVVYMELAPFMASSLLADLPLLVTEKELRSLKLKQRRMLLKRLYCMDQVISWRAYAQATGELRENSWPESIGADAPELYQQAEAEIQALVEAGKLKPVKLDIQAWSKDLLDKQTMMTAGDIEYWPGDTEWAPEEAERLIQVYVSGQELYKAGLPEWKEYIDTFKTWLLEKEYWLSADPPPYVAIVQEPEKRALDRRGHFKRDFLKQWPLAPYPEQQRRSFAEICSENTKLALDHIRRVLICRQILKELGQVIGLALEESVEFGLRAMLEPSLGRYNNLAKDLPPEYEQLRAKPHSELTEEEFEKEALLLSRVDKTPGNYMYLWAKDQKLNLSAIKLDKIRLPAKDLAEIRGWISEILGDRWWERASHKEPKHLLSPALLDWLQEEAKDGS